MHIVIHAGGIPFDGDTINEKSLGGSESAAYYVAKELSARGHKVVMFTNIEKSMESDGVRYVAMGAQSNAAPLGVNWDFYCKNTPHDINIVQRVPHAFAVHIQSKMNLWWAHDIALKRNNDASMAQAWQVNRILPVSNWFKDQIANVWNVNPEIITPIHNGVDYSLFDQFELKDNSLPGEVHPAEGFTHPKPITLIYSSRPERGLEHLVKPGGIMEQLVEKAPHVKLKVCGYEHPVPELDGLYRFLRERIDQLPNCEHIGALAKKDLVELMCTEVDIWCYPTEFEEVSCITAMEAMAAGLTIITTDAGALPETIGDYENVVTFVGPVDIDKFVNHLAQFDNKFRRRPRREYTWSQTVDEIEEIIRDEFKQSQTIDSIARHYLRHSDIVALDQLDAQAISKEVLDQLDFYDFRFDQKEYAKHYTDGTEAIYSHADFSYPDEDFIRHPRFQQVAEHLKKLPDGSRIIDYGCAHGHFTNYLAKMFPQFHFIGIDVSPSAIKCASDKAVEMKLENMEYILDDWLTDGGAKPYNVDCIILGEILEHVPDLILFMETVHSVVGDIPVIMTTPFGPWEQMSYEKEGEQRFHLHHLERADLCDLFSHLPDFYIGCLPALQHPWGDLLGWYIINFTFDSSLNAVKPIDYDRKFRETMPRQTVSFCAIVKDGARDIERLMYSIHPYVDEIIIGVDETTTDETMAIIKSFAPKIRAPFLPVQVFKIPSPIDIGFDKARNLTIKQATKEWILWADADEEFICGERLPKYLRRNGWDGYGIPQHHFAVEPLGVLSTDFPTRLFRNKPDIKFAGVVHEHPTKEADINAGVGFAWVIHELHFSHAGYPTEAVRRERFQRNISLMARDREDNPDRILGKFLWIRDLALMCRFELDANGAQVTPDMRAKAEMGLKLWEDTLDKDSDHPQVVRMVRDHLEFYSTLTTILDEGFEFKLKLSAGINNAAPQLDQVPELAARFRNKRHLDKFLSIVIDSEVQDHGQKYL